MRLAKLEQAEQEHRSRMMKLEREHRQEVARQRQSHESEIEQLKSHHDEECRRLRAERDASLEELATQLHLAQQEAVEARQAEWDAQLEILRQEHASAIIAERERVRSLEEERESVSHVRRAETDDPIESAEAGGVDSPRDRLRRLAAELDRVGRRSVDSPTAAPADEVGSDAERREAGT